MADNPAEDQAAIDPDSGTDEHARWVHEIKLYEKEAEKWESKAKKIVKRYKDDRSVNDENKARYNILWSNVQTLLPAVYARNPKPDIERRYKQKDNLGRITGEILERTTTYFVDSSKFGRAMAEAVLDRLLPGRGMVWVRYEPHYRDASIQGNDEVRDEGAQITDDIYPEEEKEAQGETQEVYYEEVCFDYIHWLDFGHTIARTKEEIRAMWRKVYLTRDELIERFDEVGKLVPLDYSPVGLNDEKLADDQKKATIYEIWNEPNEMVYWLHKDYPEILDKKEDFLGLWDFFPCPMPLLATVANDSIIPIPDYLEYQDQARELDQLTGRISSITKALKVAGVYASDAEAIQQLLAEGGENTLIPIEQWMMFAEKGGLKGVIEYLPIQEIAQTLLSLYEAREKVLGDIYQITGLADIIRGQSNPNETAAAQQLKGQFATLRLSALQTNVQDFARDLVRLAAQIIAKHFSIDTIKKICGVQLFTQQEKMQLQQQMQMQQMQAQQQPQGGQPPAPPPPLDEQTQEMLANPTWEEVEQLLRDEAMLGFRIDIETDSTIKQDEDAEKQNRVELLTAVSSFMQQAAMITDPTMKVLMAELLGFGVRGFKAGKQVEGAIQLAIDKIEKQAQNPAPPPPDPETAKLQGQMQIEQMKLQAQQQQAQQQAQNDIQKEQMKQQTIQQQNQLEAQRAAEDRASETQLERERMSNDFATRRYEIDAKKELDRELGMVGHAVSYSAASQQADKEGQQSESKAEDGEHSKAIIKALTGNLEALTKHITTPRTAKAMRNPDGSYEMRSN